MKIGLVQRLQAKSASAFHAPKQAAMVGMLLDSLRDGEAVIVLTGPPGSGKTTVVEHMLTQLGATDPALLRLAPPFPAPAELQARLQAMLALADSRDAAPADIAQALLTLEPPAPGMAGIVVVLDDAEAAPLPLLRYLSLMQALTSVGRAALQLVLVGDQMLWQRLGDPALRDLCGSVRVRLTMQPFAEAESRDFVALLLRQRGCWLAPDATADLVVGGSGLPGRMVALANTASDQSAARRSGDLLAEMGLPAGPSPPAAASESATLARPQVHPDRVLLTSFACAAAALVVAAVWWSDGRPPRPQALAAVTTTAPTSPRAIRAPESAISPEQARLEVAVLAQPADSLLRIWRGPTPRPETPHAAPHPAAAPAPLLVLADATAPKAVVVFTPGDSGGETSAWAAVRALRHAGMAVADPQQAARPSGRRGIGYFFAADRPAAAVLAHDLAAMLPTGAMLQALPMPPDPPPPGAIRVLMGP